ncbi:hypothetical protein [Streptomyces jumonjinensis]|uniref:hypothetical protein n=1 Tax=Streptomyces jumonjinensis TaxID=1945 RepID=UPI00379A3981
MPRRTRADLKAARERALADKDTVIKRYTEGESLASVAWAYGVRDTWLRSRLIEWRVPLRTHAQAMTAWWRRRAADTESTFRRTQGHPQTPPLPDA